MLPWVTGNSIPGDFYLSQFNYRAVFTSEDAELPTHRLDTAKAQRAVFFDLIQDVTR
jgi:hypothetical protein